MGSILMKSKILFFDSMKNCYLFINGVLTTKMATIITRQYNLLDPPLYMQSIVDQSIVIKHITT